MQEHALVPQLAMELEVAVSPVAELTSRLAVTLAAELSLSAAVAVASSGATWLLPAQVGLL